MAGSVAVESIRELRQICQSVHTDDFSANLVRRVSIYPTVLLIRLGFTGNAVSVLNVFIGALAGFGFCLGGIEGAIAGTALFACNAILDGCDGEVARYRKASNLTGLYADRMNSLFVYPFTLFGISVGLWRQTGEAWPMLVGFAGAWGFIALRLAKTNLDATLIDGLTMDKARRETEPKETGSEFEPFSEILRGRRRWYLWLADFLIVRQPGMVIVFCIATVLQVLRQVMLETQPITVLTSPMFYIMAGYGVVNTIAVPVVLTLILTQRRADDAFARLQQRHAGGGA
jgi:phosphatidylglycerophosphate synthase